MLVGVMQCVVQELYLLPNPKLDNGSTDNLRVRGIGLRFQAKEVVKECD